MGQLTLLLADWHWPQKPLTWLLYGGGFALALCLAIAIYIRDTRRMSSGWTAWLLLLRLATFVVLIIIALNPEDRTTGTTFRQSRVAILIDTSTSMNQREKTSVPGAATSSQASKRSRADAVIDLVSSTPLIGELQKTHDVSVFTFDDTLSTQPRLLFATPAGRRTDEKPLASLPSEAGKSSSQQDKTKTGKSDGESKSATDKPSVPTATPLRANVSKETWKKTLDPLGRETRLGEAVRELIKSEKGDQLSAIIVISDGQWNAGINPMAANVLASRKDDKVRLIAIGVGSTTRPVNIRVARIKGGDSANKGEPFDLIAFIQGDGAKDRDVQVTLMVKPEGAADTEFKVVEGATESPTVKLGGDGESREKVFHLNSPEKGKFEYKVVAKPLFNADEFDANDNERRHKVSVIERNLGVLIIAGGPMRDYRFARNMLYRHQSIDVDVWLQSVDPRTVKDISQDADDLLLEFPESFPRRPIAVRENYLPDSRHAQQYDVVIAFDPDWTSPGFPAGGHQKLVDWVSKQAGGLVAVAGDVNTPNLVSAPELQPIRNLYPVVLSRSGLLETEAKYDKPIRIAPNDRGRDISFLQLAENEVESEDVWKKFEGFYRCYPTTGKKAGTLVYMEFPDPSFTTTPILLASQSYGIGRVLYLGSGELWRLNELDSDYFDRFWVKSVREMSEGRLNRKSDYGAILPRKDKHFVGETVSLDVQLSDANNKPVLVPSVTLEVQDPTGVPLNPAPVLLQDESRPGMYVGEFTVRQPGTFRLSVENPAVQNQRIPESITVIYSQKESEDPRLNESLLVDLVRDTGGAYFSLDQFRGLLGKLGQKRKQLDDLEAKNGDAKSLANARKELQDVRQSFAELFPDQGETKITSDVRTPQWPTPLVMYLLVALLSVEWMTRKLLKLA